MYLQSSRHFPGIFKNRQKRFCSRDGLCVTRGVAGWYPGGLLVGVIRDTRRNRSVPGEKHTRDTCRTRRLPGNIIRETCGALGGFREGPVSLVLGTRGVLRRKVRRVSGLGHSEGLRRGSFGVALVV